MVRYGERNSPMVSEAIHRCERHGVDGFRTDQLLDVEHIAVGRTFRTGIGPQGPLDSCSTPSERRKTRSTEDSFELLICQSRIGDACFAEQRSRKRGVASISAYLNTVVREASGVLMRFPR